MQKIGDQLEDASAAPAEWSAYLQRGMQDNIAALQGDARLADIPGLPQGMDGAAVAQRIRESAAGFTAGLRAWPAMREAAQALAGERYG